MLHPSESDLGQPIEYVAGMWWEREIGGGERTYVPEGIRLTPGVPISSWIQVQMRYGFNADDGLLFQVASTLRLTGAEPGEFRFGVWWPTLNPFTEPTLDGVYFCKSAQDMTLSGCILSAGQVVQNVPLFELADGDFVDLPLVVHETIRASFVWSVVPGAWSSRAVAETIPHHIEPTKSLCPSFVLTAAGYLDIRSLHVEDVAMKRLEHFG